MSTKTLSGIYVSTYALNSPVTTLSITSAGYLGGGIAAAGLGAYAIVNNGVVQGGASGIGLAGSGAITNSGRIQSLSTSAGAAISLGNGGVINNGLGGAPAALIEGYYAIKIAGQAGTVTNAGSIVGVAEGVELGNGGTVTNGAGGATGALIEGGVAIIAAAAATVHNYGAVVGVGTLGVGIFLQAGGAVTNGGGGDTTAEIDCINGGVLIEGAAGTVINNGSILTTGTAGAGVIFTEGGVATNGSTANTHARIDGNVGVGADGTAATLINFGTVVGRATNQSVVASGVYFKNGGMVTNGATNDLTALIDGPQAIVMEGAAGAVQNFAIIGGLQTQIGIVLEDGGSVTNGSATDTTARIEGTVGVEITSVAGTVRNFGTILASGPSVANAGVVLASGGSVTNGSAGDTTALIQGASGVYATSAPTTVANFGSIIGARAGVLVGAGGKITNGGLTDTVATIIGQVGAGIVGGAGTIANFGTIRAGALLGVGAALQGGGVFTNGGAGDLSALISGAIGVELENGAVGTNFAIVDGNAGAGSSGASLTSGSALTNGSATDASALISAYAGVLVDAMCTLTNFGTVRGTGGVAVELSDPTARLYAEAGSTFAGVIDAESAVVTVVGGVATAGGIDSAGVIKGAGTLLLSGKTSTLLDGVSLAVAEIKVAGGATTVDSDAANLSDSRIWDQTGGTLMVGSGAKLTFTGTTNSFSGTIGGFGTIAFTAGSDRFAGLTLSAAHLSVNGAQATLAGVITDIAGFTFASGAGGAHLVIDAGGATLAGGGTLTLTNAAANVVAGATAGATLTNVDNRIQGAGKLGDGLMTLVNGAKGVIVGNDANALIINTGAASVTNAGIIEATGAGGVTIVGNVSNAGSLIAAGGDLTVKGAVSGAGTLRINGATLDVEGTTTQNAVFTGSTGVLELAHSVTYTGKVTGLSLAGTSSLDLGDISYGAGTKANFVDNGSKTGGVLTVSDGTHTAHINLVGDYAASTFITSSDGHGGTTVVDPVKGPRAASAPSLAHFVAGMASFEPRAGSLCATPEVEDTLIHRLAAPGLRA